MRKFLTSLVIILAAPFSIAAGGPSVPLDHIDNDLTDTASLQSGAKLYMNYCWSCHALGYARYNRVARDLNISEELFTEFLMFNEDKFGDHMSNSVPVDDAKRWFGTAPPDLTLVARLRGTDWLNTYLRGFYEDESRPWGVNNSVFKDVGMPHVLLELQGLCAEKPEPLGEAKYDPLTGSVITTGGCQSYSIEGSMSTAEYDEAIYDLVNFLDYMGEPTKLDRIRLGWMVLGFLLILFIVSWLYTRELNKDIH